MTRKQLIDRIQALSEEDFARVAPFLEADLDSTPPPGRLLEEILLGRLSAKHEPLVEHDDLMRRVDDQLNRSS